MSKSSRVSAYKLPITTKFKLNTGKVSFEKNEDDIFS